MYKSTCTRTFTRVEGGRVNNCQLLSTIEPYAESFLPKYRPLVCCFKSPPQILHSLWQHCCPPLSDFVQIEDMYISWDSGFPELWKSYPEFETNITVANSKSACFFTACMRVKGEKSFIGWAVVCEDRSKASHPSVREGRMNWGWRIKARIPGFTEYSRKVQKNGFNDDVGPWRMKSIRRHGSLDLSMESSRPAIL